MEQLDKEYQYGWDYRDAEENVEQGPRAGRWQGFTLQCNSCGES